MKKISKDNNQKVILIILAVVVTSVIIIFSGVVNLSTIKLGEVTCTACAGGFTVNSISTTKVISNDADLETANFIITVTANGGGQSLSGTIEPSTIKSLTGLDVGVPISIEMSGITEYLTYPIRNEGAIFEYQSVYSPETINPLDNLCIGGYEYCFGAAKANWFGLFAYSSFRAINVKKSPTGNIGSFDSPKLNWKGTLTYKIAGIPYTQEVGSASAGQDFYAGSEWVANAKWTGSLVTGEAAPSPSNYKAVYDLTSWKVAPANSYLTYRDSITKTDGQFATYKSIGYNLCTDWDCSVITNLVGTHQATVDKLKSSTTQITYAADTVGQTSQTNGLLNGIPAIVETSNRRIGNPQLVLTIRAKRLEVVIPVGKVGELSATAPTFASGDANGIITASFKNIGTGTGTFSATFTDPSGTFTMSSNTESIKTTVQSGNTGTITMYVGHGTTAQAMTKPVTVRVYDYNKPSNYAETGVTVSMTVPKACVAGNTRVSGDIVYTCKSDGSGEIITLDCTTVGGLNYKDGKYLCGKASTGTGGANNNNTNSDGSINAEKVNWYDTTPAKILMGLIVILVILLYWRKQNE